jgi:hypothetical protein
MPSSLGSAAPPQLRGALIAGPPRKSKRRRPRPGRARKGRFSARFHAPFPGRSRMRPGGAGAVPDAFGRLFAGAYLGDITMLI